MRPPFQERHFDYVLTPNLNGQVASALTTVVPGQILTGVPLVMDSDAPFLLRSIAVRCKYNSSRQQSGLESLLFRFTGPDLNYMQQDLVPASLWLPYYGQGGNPKPLMVQKAYPPLGVINVDLQNTSSSITLTNLTFYFRGVKLYPWGARPDWTYPRVMSTLNFDYPLTVSQLPVTTVPTGLRQIFTVKPDADFVIRGGQAGLPWNPAAFYETFVTLRDFDLKPYSNHPVHTDILFGNAVMSQAYACGTSFLAPVGTGGTHPGLIYPEIYLPKNQILYLDVVRQDASFAGAAAADFLIQLMGAKVFPK